MRFIVFYAERRPSILTYNTLGLQSPHDIKTLIERSLDADKAQNITLIPLDDQTGLADCMVIASGTSSRHIAAMAEKLRERLSARGVSDVRIEGLTQSDWVVVDAGDVIVHLFRPEVRAFYNIERMWGLPQPFGMAGNQISA